MPNYERSGNFFGKKLSKRKESNRHTGERKGKQNKEKMADAAAARREARRRKILENSGNRLQKIAGKSDDECSRESHSRSIRPIPEPEYELPVSTSNSGYIKASQHNGLLPNEQEPIAIQPSHEIDAAGDGEVMSDLASLLPPTSTEPIPAPIVPFWEKITLYKYDLVLLSLFIQMLYGMSIITFDRGGYFFLPVIVYIVTKLIWFPVQNTSNIANVLLLLNGMSQSRVRNILYITQCFSAISRDTFVYIFSTICIQSLWITVRDLLVT